MRPPGCGPAYPIHDQKSPLVVFTKR